MFTVSIYLETSIKGPSVKDGWYAAVIEYVNKNRKAEIREDYVLEKVTTYHKSILCALIKALKRLNASCELKIYTDSIFLKRNVENNIEMWKKNGFLNAKGEPIKNKDEWKEVAKLLAGHKVEFRITNRHLYSMRMIEEAKRRTENTRDSVNTE